MLNPIDRVPARRRAHRFVKCALLALAACASSGTATAAGAQARTSSSKTAQPEVCDPRVLAGPTQTPFTVPPTIRNRSAAIQSIEQAYPAALKARGVRGAVRLWFLIDNEGRVARAAVETSSGHPALDSAAVHAARLFRFTSPYNEREKTCVWTALPIVFPPR